MTLKDTDANGADIPFVATINSAKTIITIDPVSNFTSNQKIYAAIGATVEDFENNVIPASSKTFTAEFLKEDLENPFNEKDVIALIDAQREISKRFIEQSSYAVLNRMEWLRRNRDVNNLSEQGIKFIFGDETFSEIATTFTFDKYINRTKDLFHNDWAFWSEGTVTLGEQDNTSLASLQKIQTTGITIGVDKKVSDKKMYGFALRLGHDNVDIGTSDTNLKTDMFSLSSYATFPFNNETFIDTHIGIGSLKIDSRRKHEAGFLNGNRNGKQIFGSIVYGGEFSKEELHVSPYGRVDLGYTILDEYLDSGKVSALKYNEMKAENYVNEISVKEASAKYIAGSHVTPDMPMPEIDGISDLLKEDIKQYGMWLEQIVYNAVGSRLIAAEDYYDAGVKYMEFARYKEAIEMFETAINMKPIFPDAINTLGVCYTKTEEYPKALEFYDEAIQQGGEHPGYLLNVAITQFMLGNKGLARQKYDEVVMLDPMFAGKLDKVFGAAKASIIGGQSDGPQLKISADLESELAEGSTKGLVEVKDAPKDVKPEDIKKIDFRKRRARSDNTVGVTFARLGNYSMAIDYFKKAIKNDEEEMDYKVNLAVSLYRMYKYDQALEYYEVVKKAKPELVSQLDFIETMVESTPKFDKFD